MQLSQQYFKTEMSHLYLYTGCNLSVSSDEKSLSLSDHLYSQVFPYVSTICI